MVLQNTFLKKAQSLSINAEVYSLTCTYMPQKLTL